MQFQNSIAKIVAQFLVQHGRQNFHAAVEIARHHVGTAHVQLVSAVIAEPVDARMFEKTPHHGGDVDIFAHPRQARSEAADAAHLQVNAHPGL